MDLYIPNRRAKRMGRDAIQIGLIGQTVGAAMFIFTTCLGAARGIGWAGQLLLILGTSVLVAGCGRYAQYRRRNWWWGLLGFLNIFGVLIIVAIPRRRIGAGAGFDVMTNTPRRRDVWRMEVHIMLQGSPDPILLHLPRGATVEAAVRMLAMALPGLEPKLNAGRFLINGQPAQLKDELADQDKLEIATSVVDGAYHSKNAPPLTSA